MVARRVAILVPDTEHYTREIARGAADAARLLGWRPEAFTFSPGVDPRLACSEADGVIIHAWGSGDVIALAELAVPVVNVGLPALNAPRVLVDEVAIGRLGALHLHAMGYRSFAYLGFTGEAFSVRKQEGFAAACAAAGWPCAVRTVLHLRGKDAADTRLLRDDLRRWLTALPRPVGLMSAWDRSARTLAGLCADAGLDVPRDVGVLGVNDDEHIWAACTPLLSSIALPGRAIGAQAMACVADHAAGREVPPVTWLPPDGVRARASTALRDHADPRVAGALAAMARDLAKPLDLAALAAAAGVTRRTLERLFRRGCGRSPAAELRRLRVARACELLRDPALSLAQVAGACGLGDRYRLVASFRAVMGTTPGRWRRGERKAGDET